MAGAHDGFFHEIGRIFGHHDSGLRRGQQRDAAGLPELERRGSIAVDEGRLDGRFVRPELGNDPAQSQMNGHEAHRERCLVVGRKRAAGHVCQPVAVDLDNTPAGAAQPRIDAQNANRISGHGTCDSPGAASRLERIGRIMPRAQVGAAGTRA